MNRKDKIDRIKKGLCLYRNEAGQCPRKAKAGWTTCPRHYTAGMSKKQLLKLWSMQEGKTLRSKRPPIYYIADKHGVHPDVIERELDKGIKVEKEHTSNERMARKIALDHLEELPDYYTRLKKMEEGKTYGRFLNYLQGKVKKADDWANSGHTAKGVIYKKAKDKIDRVNDWAHSEGKPVEEPKAEEPKKSKTQKTRTRTTQKTRTRPKKSKLGTAITKAFNKGYRTKSKKSRTKAIRPTRSGYSRVKAKRSFSKRYLRHISPI